MKRILFVDDEAPILQGLQRMLRPLRHEWDMHFAASGRAALEDMAQGPAFDVVVTDLHMPQMDGVEFLANVMERYPQTVRIVLSGHTDTDTLFRAADVSHQFISKPCEPEMLKKIVEHAFALRAYLNNERLQRLLSRLTHIPSVPDLYLQVVRELRETEPSLKRIAEIIEQDFGMCAKLLHFVNSAHFGLPNTISSPLQAINYIGTNNLRSMILSAALFSSVDGCSLPANFSLTQLWQHSMRVAAYARIIAKAENTTGKLVDDAYMAGLLHDSGSLVLASNLPQLYTIVLDQMREKNRPLHEIEVQVLGASHAEVGAYLLALWGLPDTIVEAVAFHQCPSLSLGDTLSPLVIVHAADYIHKSLMESGYDEGTELDNAYLIRLGLLENIPAWRAVCQKLA